MEAGFNIAVAEFTTVDENGESIVTEDSQQSQDRAVQLAQKGEPVQERLPDAP